MLCTEQRRDREHQIVTISCHFLFSDWQKNVLTISSNGKYFLQCAYLCKIDKYLQRYLKMHYHLGFAYVFMRRAF